MRIIEQSKLDVLGLEEHERFFVELWYSMTHKQSLDSYRVKCMNSRTIIRELAQELNMRRVKDLELKHLCAEVKAIITKDPICSKYFRKQLEILLPFLDQEQILEDKQGKDGKDNKAEVTRRRRFLIIADDFSVQLQRNYFTSICGYVPDAIKPNNHDEIECLLSSLLSDLIDCGWPLETLFSWHKHFISTTKDKTYSFKENLSFMLRIFLSPPQEYEVTLKLLNTNKLNRIEKHGNFTFSVNVESPGESADMQKFFKPSQSVCFAQTTVTESDILSAAILARESFQQLIDLFRFAFEPGKLEIDRRSYVRRLGDGKDGLLYVGQIVPNPSEDIGHQDFVTFSQDLDAVYTKSKIEESSRTQLQAAIRQYRFGRDSEDYKDKFLNWWQGLEALAYVEPGNIGSTVMYNVSRAMAVPYLFRIVYDLLSTLKYCRVDWTEKLKLVSGCEDLNELSLPQLLIVLQNSDSQSELWEKCNGNPTLVYRGKRIGQIVNDSTIAKEHLENHLHHLEWHLSRLYRIRCCIVHGSEIRFRLNLFAANLEFYLKQLIQIVLNTFKENDHIRNLDDIFVRSAFTYERMVTSLSGEGVNCEQLRRIVLTNTVLSE